MDSVRLLLFAGGIGLATVAVAETLKIEPGLWSVTYTYVVEGKPPAELLANLPPDKRAAAEAAWTARAGTPQTTTSDECMTAEDIASGNGFADNGEDEDCQRKVNSQTATHWSGVEHCTSQNRVSDRVVDIVAENPKSVSGSMHGQEGDSNQMRMTFTSTWIAAECGDAD
jgi:hypothetical protein